MITQPPFRDRSDAGRVLARSLSRYATESGVVVLGLARGGVAVARQVAESLGAPLGVMVARKIGVPGIEEVALGAITEGSRRIVADAVSRYLGVPGPVVEQLAARERVELERSAALYHAGRALPELRGRVVLLVDDGLATGVTLRAAARVVRGAHAARVIAAVPVASRWGAQEVRAEVDELTAVVTPATFETVAAAYEDYAAVGDEDVLALLGRPIRRVSPAVRDISARLETALPWSDGGSSTRERTILIPSIGGVIAADLGMPAGLYANEARRAASVRGLVIVAHGSGSSRNSYRNRYIAGRLRLAGYATLRLDLLTGPEQRTDVDGARFGFDVERLAARLASACDWAVREGVAGANRMTLMGASTGAAAALLTAARRQRHVWAVVARAGRVDLVAHALSDVHAPVLLLVGAADQATLRRNGDALRLLPPGATLVKIPRAGHGFDEPGTLGVLTEHVVSWLDRLERTTRYRFGASRT